MQLGERPIAITDRTLTVLINELGEECSNVLGLLYQLQLQIITGSKIRCLSRIVGGIDSST
jgi:hypothetical protein